MVVLPALSNPRMSIRTSFEPNKDWKTREKRMPMVLGVYVARGGGAAVTTRPGGFGDFGCGAALNRKERSGSR